MQGAAGASCNERRKNRHHVSLMPHSIKISCVRCLAEAEDHVSELLLVHELSAIGTGPYRIINPHTVIARRSSVFRDAVWAYLILEGLVGFTLLVSCKTACLHRQMGLDLEGPPHRHCAAFRARAAAKAELTIDFTRGQPWESLLPSSFVLFPNRAGICNESDHCR